MITRLLSGAFLLLTHLCLAQFADNFSDGDFSSNPNWTGSTNFIVNASSQLQLNNSVASTSSLASSFLAATLDNFEWQVYVKQTFASSGSNYGRVYLASDQVNLTGPLNGYYLQFGEAGATDAVELFRQSGLVTTSVCRATNGLIAASFALRVRVLRNGAGLWKLMIDYTGGTNFVQEASGTDATFNSSAALGVVCVYTASNANKFFYDDFFMGPEIVDLAPPTIVSVTPMSAATLDVLFNEKVHSTSAQLLSNYSVNNGVGNPVSATLQADEKTVTLSFAQQFPNAITCQLTISGVQDLFSNAMPLGNQNFLFFQSVPAELRDIIITEIFADPSPTVGLPELEFVEIYNNSSKIFDLQDWKITDGGSMGSLPSHLFFPNEYVILTAASSASQFSPYGTVLGISNFPTLNNSGDQLSLKDNTGVEINSVSYTLDWYDDDDKQQGGYSLELIDPANVCAESGNWVGSEAAIGGTPGTQNSVFASLADLIGPKLISVLSISATEIIVLFDEKLRNDTPVLTDFIITPSILVSQISFTDGSLKSFQLTLNAALQTGAIYTITAHNIFDCPGNVIGHNSFVFGLPEVADSLDVVLTEVLFNPSPTVGLPQSEFVEIYNRSNKIIDLKDWKITDGSSTGVLPSHPLFPNEYVILTSTSAVPQFSSYGTTLGVVNFPTLNNSGEALTLKDNTDAIINRVPYTADWYRDDEKNQGGYSLELIDPTNMCAEENNWIASEAAIGGTPASQNSVFATNPDLVGPKLISAFPTSATAITVQFDERLHTQLPATSDFSITPFVAVSQLSFADEALKTLQLTLSSSLQTQLIYSITAQNILDCPGNSIGNNTFVFGLPEVADSLDIAINEVLFNPSPTVGLPDAEFIELYNRSNKIIDLKDWKITDGSSTGVLPLNMFFPNEYVILTSPLSVAQFSSYGTTLGVVNFPTLNNSGEQLTVKDHADYTISQVPFTNDWYRDDEKKQGGYSLELIDPANVCAEESNWIASEAAGGGTPGAPNSVLANKPDLTGPKLISAIPTSSTDIIVQFNERLQTQLPAPADFAIVPAADISQIVFVGESLRTIHLTLSTALQSGVAYTIAASHVYDCPGNLVDSQANTFSFGLPETADSLDLLVNEILFNPRPTGTDFVEIKNNSQKFINLKNWSLANYVEGNLSNVSPITEENFLLPPGQLIVFAEDTDVVKGEYVLAVEENLFRVANLPPFNDDEGTVVLADSLLNVIDFFAYADDYHSVFIDDDEGVSLERISLADASNEADNWKSASSTVGFATPGFANSNVPGEPTAGEIAVTPEIFEPLSGQPSFTQIHYKFTSGGSVANVKILDIHGREIKQIVSNAILGTEGFFRWDGDTNEGTKARTGYYIVWVELFNANGSVHTFRKRVIVASADH